MLASSKDSHLITQSHFPQSTPLFGVLPHLATVTQPIPTMGKKAAGADSKPRGRMSAYAYFMQTCREEQKKKHPNENVVFIEFSKRCAERWKGMSSQKKRFQDMADRDKERYDSEMANYAPSGGAKGKGKKRAKDPNAPKRALSAFFWFCQGERSKVKAMNPDHTVGDVAKELGKRWNEFTTDTKYQYEQMAAKDKARYEREIKAYKTKATKGPSPAKMPGKGAVQQQQYDDEDDESMDDEGDDDEEESGSD